jgi:hypothetical protein
MGYWEQNEEGASFADRDDKDAPPMLWGDQPADLVDGMINDVIAVFIKDIGRLPSRAEMMAGLTFSTRMLSLPDRPEDCPEVPEDDIKTVEQHYYAAVHGEQPGAKRIPQWQVEADRAVGEVISRLKEPYEKS